MDEPLIPARPNPRFTSFFARYCRRMLAKNFSCVRLTNGSRPVLQSINGHDGPAVVAMNHPSWWEPIVGLMLAEHFAPSRVLSSPIDAEQLRKFAFMRKIGLFGIEPTHPDAFSLFTQHALELFENEPRTLLGVTPQGAFTDVRSPVRLRPGIASVLSKLGNDRGTPAVVSVACEYPFWFEKKPELLIHASLVPQPSKASTAAWTRVITDAMERDRVRLAELSLARNQEDFEPLFAARGPAIHPVYDAFLRLRGKRAQIQPPRGIEGASA